MYLIFEWGGRRADVSCMRKREWINQFFSIIHTHQTGILHESRKILEKESLVAGLCLGYLLVFIGWIPKKQHISLGRRLRGQPVGKVSRVAKKSLAPPFSHQSIIFWKYPLSKVQDSEVKSSTRPKEGIEGHPGYVPHSQKGQVPLCRVGNTKILIHANDQLCVPNKVLTDSTGCGKSGNQPTPEAWQFTYIDFSIVSIATHKELVVRTSIGLYRPLMI